MSIKLFRILLIMSLYNTSDGCLTEYSLFYRLILLMVYMLALSIYLYIHMLQNSSSEFPALTEVCIVVHVADSVQLNLNVRYPRSDSFLYLICQSVLLKR